MILRQYKPRPELQHFVSRIIVNGFQLNTSEPRPVIPFPPHPEHTLFFYPHDQISHYNYADGRFGISPRAMIVGPQLARVDLMMGYNMLVVLVLFQPGGMHRLLRLPMHEIVDRPIDASLMLGNEVNDIAGQLAAAADPDEMAGIVQRYLVTKVNNLKRTLPLETVLMKSVVQGNLSNVDALAREACVSVRQLERQFHERVGMSPKVFARLVRFSKAWVMRERRPDISWSTIAHECNYADQMHMIRDFKDFAGVTPGILQADLEKNSLRLQSSTLD